MNESIVTDVGGALELGSATVNWLEFVQSVLTQHSSGNTECDEELERVLVSAQAAILRWRLEVGVCNGLMKLREVPDWVCDEFD